MKRRSRRYVSRTKNRNLVWINGYNVFTLSPRVTAVPASNRNYTTKLLEPADWDAGGPAKTVNLLRLAYWIEARPVDNDSPLQECRLPYALFLTDFNLDDADPNLITGMLGSATWPLWAQNNPRILHIGTVQAGRAEGEGTIGTSSWFYVTNGALENVMNVKLNRKLNADDSVRVAVGPPPDVEYLSGASFWTVSVVSRMLVRIP